MDDVVFVTGNQDKADYVSRHLGRPIEHVKLDLGELQSLHLQEIVSHKVRQAYEKIKRPVMVEDVSLECVGLDGLPGPFVKWFLETLTAEGICRLLDGKSRSATVRCMVGYFDGKEEKYFLGASSGSIAEHPYTGIGYGIDPIFIHEGFDMPRSGMSADDHDRTYFEFKPFDRLKEYLETKTSRT